MLSMKKKFTIWLMSLFCLALCGCASSSEPVQKSGFYFDTVILLTGYGPDAENVLEEGLSLCSRYERLFSYTLEGSDIWNINHAGGKAVTVDEETAWLLSKALEYAALSDGLIDPTITPLSRLWNFSGDPPGPVPSNDQIRALLSHVDYHGIRIEGNQVQLADPNAAVDLGFIAKGYIADQLKALFLERGLDHALINLGGNVLAVGSKPDGSSFRTGIQKPDAARGESVQIIDLSDRSLVSSGNYERYFMENGVRYHHILNPFTGYPADSGLLGVTILSDSSLEGDALSTTCFLLGLEKGSELIESLPDVEALFITQDGSVYKTDGFPDAD